MGNDREERIQAAMKDAESKWDELYSQEDWEVKPLERTKIPKSHRVGKGYASKALKNL